jgi:hypothetical protein
MATRDNHLSISRRLLLATGVASLSTCFARTLFACEGRGLASSELRPARIGPALLARALGALMQHHAAIPRHDTMGIVDFSLPSSMPRFHLLDMANGSVSSHLVAHGRGSDPAHTGWLERFSNEPQSHASSAGAFKTGELYAGSHGRSLHLEGLDPSNSNAAARAIVVHGAPYVSAEMILDHGMLGRSFGCFALGDSSLGEVLSRLGPGRMIYADKV